MLPRATVLAIAAGVAALVAMSAAPTPGQDESPAAPQNDSQGHTAPHLAAPQHAEQRFVDQVWPILERRCVNCHGPDQQEAGLRLDSLPSMLGGGKQGPALVPGHPARSLIVRAIRHETPRLAMPPRERLTATEASAIERWIADGAAWPQPRARSDPADSAAQAGGERIGPAWVDARNPIVRIFGGERLDLWSLRPIERHAPPPTHGGGWSRNPIDRFILARLDEAGRAPAAEADRRTLARRLHFDLTGLPPTPQELRAFLADERPDAYERLVDRLLASPAHGPHAARIWLDAIRYSDSNGFDWDEFRPRAWLVRDYVIRSFQQDKPFDQFVREQLAGDELLDGPPRTPAEQDALIATGYLRLGPQDNSASLFNEQARARAEWMSDLVETTGSALLGMTMSCCRCHDHKHDPLSQSDYYRLRAFFEPLRFADDLPLDLAGEQEVIRAHNERVDAAIAALDEQRKRLRDAVRDRLRRQRIEALSPAEQHLLARPPQEPNDRQKAELAALMKQVEPSDEDILAASTEAERQQVGQLDEQIKQHRAGRRSFSVGLLATDKQGDAAVTHVLYQGNHKDPREAVEPGFFSALDPSPAAIGPPPGAATSGRRLALANWIVAHDNPLTARVLVNRLWQSHFGAGIVETANDFGRAGTPPTHPELLDWLASELIDSGWSIKHVRRLIVTSATYRQSSIVASPRGESDKDNRLYGRQNSRRLSAEQLRDALLTVSGLLDRRLGGPPVWPELPAEILQANPAFLDDNATRTKGWYPSPAELQDARSILLVQKRTVPIPFLETFDLPENSTSCGRRATSIVVPQALSLLNSPLAVRAATALAESVEREVARHHAEAGQGEPPDDPAEMRQSLVRAAFRRALQREPVEAELAACARLLERRSLAELCRVLLNLNEFVFID